MSGLHGLRQIDDVELAQNPSPNPNPRPVKFVAVQLSRAPTAHGGGTAAETATQTTAAAARAGMIFLLRQCTLTQQDTELRGTLRTPHAEIHVAVASTNDTELRGALRTPHAETHVAVASTNDASASDAWFHGAPDDTSSKHATNASSTRLCGMKGTQEV